MVRSRKGRQSTPEVVNLRETELKETEGFPSVSAVSNPLANAENTGSISGLGRPTEEEKWQPTPVFLARKSHGQRSLVGYSPPGRKESDRA